MNQAGKREIIEGAIGQKLQKISNDYKTKKETRKKK